MQIYPAIFLKEDNNTISVFFADFDGATSGENVEQAYKMAIDFLGLKLYDYYIKNQNYKIATDINKINVLECLKERTGATDEELKNLNYFLTYIPVDLLKVLKQSDNRVTRKNVSIPIWLDKIGKNKNINFSKVLTEALIEKLKLKEDNNYIF